VSGIGPVRQLPIYEIEDRIVEAAKAQSRLILRAPTGSGKSTQVPQMLLDRVVPDVGQIVVLQPRRMAARMLASRVAQERGESLGQTVGYQVRMEGKSSAKTRILYVTEGILLRRMIGDPELRGVSAVVFDEFHERHLYGDITLARALDLQETSRPDLKIVVMSATLEVGELEKYLAPCEVLESAGRTFPVEIRHAERSPGDTPPWELAAEALSAHAPGNSPPRRCRHTRPATLLFSCRAPTKSNARSTRSGRHRPCATLPFSLCTAKCRRASRTKRWHPAGDARLSSRPMWRRRR